MTVMDIVIFCSGFLAGGFVHFLLAHSGHPEIRRDRDAMLARKAVGFEPRRGGSPGRSEAEASPNAD